MRSNGLLKWLMIPMALLVVFVGFKLFSGGGSQTSGDGGPQLTPEEARALGIEGDTPRDTVATLVGLVRQLRGELQTALGDNRTQKAENERLRAREGSIDRRIQSALENERNLMRQDREQVAGERQRTQGMLQDLQRRIEGLKDGELPVGLGLDGEIADGVRWVEPDDARREKRSGVAGDGFSFPTSFGPAQGLLGGDEASTEDSRTTTAPSAKPVYTVPTNSTLMGSIAMTALIGRVPIDGTVNDPYPFKVLIGPDNLTANGIDIPDVAGAVVSGMASGDWTLSCVRGQIRSVTFVFNDGTIRTVPEDGGRNGNRQHSNDGNGNSSTQDGLGWISDPYGIPCVSGERRSNAQQYLGTQALITAAGAGAASLIKSGNGSVAVVNNRDGSIGTVGISGNEAMGRILAGGVQDMSAWVNKLYGQAFAAVYVRPGAKVAVHIEQPLTIDYDPKGRKVDHRIGDTTHAQDLD
ncbi:TIGR03752 family integrating conjugative element protein [Shinella sumterensis]|uniref:Integrating conjugative element protein (TIGR03752 family) n=1 Tax=Rhizobium subbaraonis TaxID=908946 RepID=A0A285USS1_9HYPH|nr:MULTISPECIES: TIGR03752 family integrating conjugative element protein [Rhizobiaceae]MCW5712344.1 TIGR03752 family integrating conjugative element protein [Shinella sp.]WLS08749.1 TIGR03752 family integrating conjugative element protein [Shinella sumterensis]SOC44737.1 integrating conjugative element protein (TIGR03752 family) [Rhizobium subbaraonis]